jgi:hypothetical protein
MYLLNHAQVPQNSIFSRCDARCLALTMNLALRKRGFFKFFTDLPFHVKTKFAATFEKQLGFHTLKDVKGKLCMADCTIGNLFFRLLYETWTKLHVDDTNGMSDRENFLEYDHDFMTNEVYLHNEPRTVRNVDIVEFARKCLKTGLFVGNAYGFKTYYGTTPSGYIDISKEGKLSEFSQLASDRIMLSLPLNFNTEPFPDHIRFPGISHFRHDLCNVVYGIDIGHEVTPLDENTSLVPGGFSAKRYLKELLKSKIPRVARQPIITEGTQKYCSLHCFYMFL